MVLSHIAMTDHYQFPAGSRPQGEARGFRDPMLTSGLYAAYGLNFMDDDYH